MIPKGESTFVIGSPKPLKLIFDPSLIEIIAPKSGTCPADYTLSLDSDSELDPLDPTVFVFSQGGENSLPNLTVDTQNSSKARKYQLSLSARFANDVYKAYSSSFSVVIQKPEPPEVEDLSESVANELFADVESKVFSSIPDSLKI